MGEVIEEYRRTDGICDICSRRCRVTITLLDGVTVSAQCRACEKRKDNDES